MMQGCINKHTKLVHCSACQISNTVNAEDGLKCVSNLPHSYVIEHCDVITDHCDVIITLVARANLLPIVYDLLQGLSLKDTVQQGT